MAARAFDAGTDQLLCKLADGMATITQNRQDVRNAWSDAGVARRKRSSVRPTGCHWSSRAGGAVPGSGWRFHGQRDFRRRREFEAVELALQGRNSL
jgi:hypothetical protein